MIQDSDHLTSSDASKFQTVLVPLECACLLNRFSHVWLFATLRTVAHHVPLSMGFSRPRILEWVAMPSSRVSSQPRDRTCVSYVSCIAGWILYHWATRESLQTFNLFLGVLILIAGVPPYSLLPAFLSSCSAQCPYILSTLGPVLSLQAISPKKWILCSWNQAQGIQEKQQQQQKTHTKTQHL